MPRRSKAEGQRDHARRRALERFGMHLSDGDIDAIVLHIQQGRARHVEKYSRRLSVFCIRRHGQQLFALYDKDRKSIATFLTERMVVGHERDVDVEGY